EVRDRLSPFVEHGSIDVETLHEGVVGVHQSAVQQHDGRYAVVLSRLDGLHPAARMTYRRHVARIDTTVVVATDPTVLLERPLEPRDQVLGEGRERRPGTGRLATPLARLGGLAIGSRSEEHT